MGIEIGKSGFNFQDRIDFLRTLASWLSSGGGNMAPPPSAKSAITKSWLATMQSLSSRSVRALKNGH